MSAFQFLLLEANLTDTEVVQATLLEGGINCEILRVETHADFIRTLETDKIDLILADYALSSFDEIAALPIARCLRPDTPFIFISGSLGEELAIEAIKQGATDYVLKQRLGRLVPSVQRALQQAQELDKDTTKCKQAETTVESDLKDTQLLHELSARLVTEGDIQTLYQEIMAAAIALTRADAGTVQILDEATQELLLLATQSFEQNMREHFYRVNASSNTPCGIALRNGDRTFLDFDVPKSADPDGSMQMHVEAGYFSAQSTPLITRSGKPIGMVSTHWREHHRPSDRELRFLDLLARQAADLIEQRQAQVTLRESQARLQSVANLVPDLLWDSEPHGSTNWYNQRWMEYTGQTFDEAIGWGWIDAIHPDDREASARRYREAVEQSVRLQQEHRIRRHDGEYRWFVVNAFPLKDESGKVVKMYGAATDIHEQRVALEALRESEAKYRSLFESINDGFCVIEVIFDQNEKPIDYRFLEISPSFERQIGLVNTLGKRVRELIPNHEEYWFEIYGNVVLSGQSIRFENYARELQRWFNVYAFPVREPEDRQVAVVFSVINDRKQAEENRIQLIREQAAHEEERQRAESLAEVDRAKTLFFSNVSHEFRTPLTLLLAPLQDALSDSANPLTQKQRELLKLAHCNSLRLLKLVNTLLYFSRIEADRLNANYEPTDLSTYTAELASVFRSAIENANLQLVVNCPPLPDPIYVDRQMWEKIVLNLLSNALKFTFEGIISVSLKPVKEAREQGSRGAGEQGSNSSLLPLCTSAPLPLLDAPCLFVELTVSDTGVGISASELPHLFERFYQVKGAKGRSYEGSGIGLSLVQELVKRHGGAIAVTSAVDQGTIFTVTIPTGIAHLPADQIWVASTLASSAVTANAFVEEALHWLPEESTEFQNSEVQVQNSEVHAQNSEVQAQNSEVQAQSLEVHAQSLEVQAQSLEVQVQSSEVHAQSSEVQVQSSEVHAQSSEVQVQNSKRARILLVDDNADMRGYLKRLLNQYYEVETVNDGLAALTAIRRGGSAIYDLVLTDVMMPRMDGFELLRSLRASLNTQTIPIILLSARAGEESRVEGLESGADDYLIKPFSARELLARVNANLQLAQLRCEAAYREQVMQAVQTLNERLEQQVKARTAQLEAINQELEAFSSSISHDLRTPLRYITSFAEQLQAKLNATLVDASSLQILNIITKSALEAEKMVDDLLEFSRLGQTKISLTTVNISQLVQQVQEQLQLELVGRSLHWEIEPLLTAKGDPALLRLVLQNLLSNAVKYTHNNSEAAIKIGRIEQEQEVIFFVKDNGAGFDMKYCDQLFSIFQRLHPQEQFPGTGVGLATVRRIIHRHGGRIWAEGAIDQGATFYFSLPKREAQL